MISVVIPAYNEEFRLPETVRAVREHLDKRKHEIIVVDDGSSDQTAKIAKQYSCQVIGHPSNLGKGAAVKTGVLAARGSLILVTDADMAAPMVEMKKLEKMMQMGADIVIGSREAPGAYVKRASFRRKLAGKIFNLIVRMSTGLKYRDTQCGFKLFKGDAARVLFTSAECSGYCFDVEVLLLAREMGFEVKEVGVEWYDRPGSKVGLLRDGWKMFRELTGMMKVFNCIRGAKVTRAGLNNKASVRGI